MNPADSLSLEALQSTLSKCGTAVASEQAKQLHAYLELLLRWNARTNLTAVREPLAIVERHFADSLFCAQQVPPTAQTVLDFGSGGGFPGVPLAILRPELSVTLAESQSKKAAFLREAVRTLGLTTKVWAQRVELMPAEQRFDCVTLRAVDQMLLACPLAAERLAPGGILLAFSTERLRESVEQTLPAWHWSQTALPHSEQGLLLSASR